MVQGAGEGMAVRAQAAGGQSLLRYVWMGVYALKNVK